MQRRGRMRGRENVLSNASVRIPSAIVGLLHLGRGGTAGEVTISGPSFIHIIITKMHVVKYSVNCRTQTD